MPLHPPYLEAIFIYPVKSCGGIQLTEATLTPRGILHDREFVVVDAERRFLSQRKFPKMALIQPEIRGTCLILHAPQTSPFHLRFASIGAGYRHNGINIWQRKGDGIDCGPDAAYWFSKVLETECRLIARDPEGTSRVRRSEFLGADVPLAWQDGDPVHILSRSSLRKANSTVHGVLNINRFRPNLIVEGCLPHAEDGWRNVEIGGAQMKFARHCSRCDMPLVDPRTGTKNELELLTPLWNARRNVAPVKGERHGIMFGANFLPLVDGAVIHVNQHISVR